MAAEQAAKTEFVGNIIQEALHPDNIRRYRSEYVAAIARFLKQHMTEHENEAYTAIRPLGAGAFCRVAGAAGTAFMAGIAIRNLDEARKPVYASGRLSKGL